MGRYAICVLDDKGRNRCYIVEPIALRGGMLLARRGSTDFSVPMARIVDSSPIDSDVPLAQQAMCLLV